MKFALPSIDDEAIAGVAMTIYKIACRERPDALEWLALFHEYSHQIDDLIDNKVTDPEAFLSILGHAVIVYSHPFYAANAVRLALPVLTVTSAYADSLLWAHADDEWKRQWADSLRFAGTELCVVVAALCGGYQRMRDVSIALRELAWKAHHDADGRQH